MTNHKILLVDDDRDVLEMLLSIFQRAGYLGTFCLEVRITKNACATQSHASA